MSTRGKMIVVLACVAAPCLWARERPVPATLPTSRPSGSLVGPTTAPTTGPAASGWQSPPLDGEFAVLSTRSIFLHGRPPPVRPEGASAAGAGAASGPGMVLRGVARQGESPMALIEDLAAGRTRELHVGDAIGAGKVVAITPDGFDRAIDGKVSHVKVGQPVDGAAPAAAPPTAVVAQNGPPMPMPGTEQASTSTTTPVPLVAGAKIVPDKD